MFKIEQVALAPLSKDSVRFRDLMELLGWTEWTKDTVEASGHVYGEEARNTAELAFNYDAMEDTPGELEVLSYKDGKNWLPYEPVVSHLGMHVSEDELQKWRKDLEDLGYEVAQEVVTEHHTNPFLIQTGRRYHYLIMRTREVLGVDLKFIARIEPT